jgi:hypothetical protein
MINGPAGPQYEACVAVPGGSRSLHIDESQIPEYNANPDAFVAKHFGMTVQEYREWVQLDGMPLCGTITKKGSFCRNPVGRIQMKAKEWLAKHRICYCTVHQRRLEAPGRRR